LAHRFASRDGDVQWIRIGIVREHELAAAFIEQIELQTLPGKTPGQLLVGTREMPVQCVRGVGCGGGNVNLVHRETTRVRTDFLTNGEVGFVNGPCQRDSGRHRQIGRHIDCPCREKLASSPAFSGEPEHREGDE
jgi:hypothetical protein